MIKVVYYNSILRCYRTGVVERLIKQKGWRVVDNTANTNHGYNHINIDGKMILRHRIIAYCWLALENIDGGNGIDDIDHIDGHKLNNAVNNLRIVTHQQNNWNQTRAKGYCKQGNKWHAQIRINRKAIYLGLFDNEIDARNAYLNAKRLYHII